MAKKITLITGSHLSSNPRLVKEAKSLILAGYEVQILCAQNISGLTEFDEDIFKELDPSLIKIIDYQRKGFKANLLRIKSNFRAKLASLPIINFLQYSKWLSKSRMLPEMKSNLVEMKADLFIAHNLAALPAAAWAASYHKTSYSFDAEDFHRGETNDKKEELEVIALEDQYLPSCVYVSTASPFSTTLYQKIYPKQNVFTINNVFPYVPQVPRNKKENNPIKIVWFSQTIGLNRGLQEFLQTGLGNLNPNKYEVHLRGSHTLKLKAELLNLLSDEWRTKVFFYEQCSAFYLAEWLRGFDIGLALEIKETLNRDICISNKIFQYISAGLGVIATNTKGQAWVMEQVPAIGIIVEHDKMYGVSEFLEDCYQNPLSLKMIKETAANAASSVFNWDLEQNKFIDEVSSVFKPL